MLSFSGSLKVFIALDACDMRAGINTLHALVADKLKEDSRSGSLFVFTNKRRRLIKVLYWDGTGMWLMVKRLEQGTFFWPRPAQDGQTKLELVSEAFAMLTDGIDMRGAKPRGWYERT
ncbi:MAG: transposase [Verrucomicrobiaceae bacterium]|nr:transposase [Verrucomicrobiaceae bacterium]